MPEKVVTFGNKAGFGPDLVYADFEMLKNGTRMREIHENWQALYPSKFVLLAATTYLVCDITSGSNADRFAIQRDVDM